MRARSIALLLALILAHPVALSAVLVEVRHEEGVAHGFLTLKTLEGETIATGDLIQTTRGPRVTTRLVFHFADRSVHDETVVFTQHGHFRLVSDHLVQKGPSFPRPIDVSVDAGSGRVSVRYKDDGQDKVLSERMALPPDTANGMLLALLKNIPPAAARTTVSMVAASPKPRLVKLAIEPLGEDPFSLGGSSRKATHYVVKVEIGGIAGVVAPLVGKQPEDTHVWILGGEAPAFVRMKGQLYPEGPVWRIDLLSPTWPKPSPTRTP